jgi:hypothetical protein
VVYGVLDHSKKSFLIAICVLIAATFAMAVVLHLTCPQFNLPKYKIPLFPYLPVASILLNSVLMASLPARAYIQLAVFFAIMVFIYLVYSVHAATHYEKVSGMISDLEGQKAADLGDVRELSVPVSFTERPLSWRQSGGVRRLPPPTL